MTVIVKKVLKPAIVTIVAQILKTNFQNATLVSKPGELPTIHAPSVPINSHAEAVLKSGLPYVYRTLKFSTAALLDHCSFYIELLIILHSVLSRSCPEGDDLGAFEGRPQALVDMTGRSCTHGSRKRLTGTTATG